MSQYRDLFEIQMQDNPIQLTVSHSDDILTIAEYKGDETKSSLMSYGRQSGHLLAFSIKYVFAYLNCTLVLIISALTLAPSIYLDLGVFEYHIICLKCSI